ncbi:MAG: PaaI family thioesterase [Maritimibacter sp.]
MSDENKLIEAPSPVQELLGFRLVEWADGFARCELPVSEKLHNRHGIPHGGIYATLLDSAMGYAGSYTGSADQRLMSMTLSLNVNFLSRPKGGLLIATGRRTGGGAKTFFTEGEILDETGEKVATGTGVFRYRAG